MRSIPTRTRHIDTSSMSSAIALQSLRERFAYLLDDADRSAEELARRRGAKHLSTKPYGD